MELRAQGPEVFLWKENTCIGRARWAGDTLEVFSIDPAWRRRGYGSYFLKELLRGRGGFDRGAASCFWAPAPPAQDAAACALLQKFGFVPAAGGRWVRRRVPDLSAVTLCHELLAARLRPGGLYVDATCGNGHDTLFLCGLAGENGRVLGLDIQPAAVEATNRRLAAAGFGGVGRAVLCGHENLLMLVEPGTADCVLFNFGWLPGADHAVHSGTATTLPALRAACTALRPGGVLAAVLYSGSVIGSGEKQAALDFFRSLPLTQYTALVCEFANWADTAPLPCLAIKRG